MLSQLFKKIIFTPEVVHAYSAGISNVGKKRDHNEDQFLIDERLGLFVVADGMGGHEAGEVASQLALDTILTHLQKLTLNYKQAIKHYEQSPNKIIRSLLQDAIEDANNQAHCHNIARGSPEGKGMGTTITGLLISSLPDPSKRKVYLFNVGDSRIYSFRKGALKQLSIDHSLYQLWLNTGSKGSPPKHNIIYKAVGPWKTMMADQHTLNIHNEELFLLCSDGLYDMLSDEEIETILTVNSHQTLKKMAQALIDSANNAGGHDNITVILVKP
ncbi:MAG: serine/threonine-protein phosphatase [Gammaproteobacteria bacterium]|nr:serine/threonine-protein phosphatase [Gammaproteobacteria bacterium]